MSSDYERQEQARALIALFNQLYMESTEACAKAIYEAIEKRENLVEVLEEFSKNPKDPALEGKATAANARYRESLIVQLETAKTMVRGIEVFVSAIPG